MAGAILLSLSLTAFVILEFFASSALMSTACLFLIPWTRNMAFLPNILFFVFFFFLPSLSLLACSASTSRLAQYYHTRLVRCGLNKSDRTRDLRCIPPLNPRLPPSAHEWLACKIRPSP